MKSELYRLPPPEAEAIHHSEKLSGLIRNKIKLNSSQISFSQYMQMALYEPGLGYYSAGSVKFGKQGDFITAPEISPIFSQCLAMQCAQILDSLQKSTILELGPGSGVMACEILLELEELDCLPEKYFLLETSADLKAKQLAMFSSKIPELMDRIRWIDKLPDNSFTGVILANEVLDALPVCRIKINGEQIFEYMVGIDNTKKFIWTEKPADNELRDAFRKKTENIDHDLPDGYLTEINLLMPTWLDSILNMLSKGVALFIDYGYSAREYLHPQRSNGTLVCHFRHHVHDDPFFYPGLQDISASVDFTQVAECAMLSGLQVSGFTTQAQFLLGCGLEKLFVNHQAKNMSEQIAFSKQVKSLTLPGEMGDRFKVIALNRDLEIPLIGFDKYDMRSRL